MKKPYSPFPVPVRSRLLDTQQDGSARFSQTWVDWLANVARKSGRSLVWRGTWSADLEYSVCDVVFHASALWTAQQAQPFNGRSTTPGTEDAKDEADRVWVLMIEAIAANGLPAGGTDGQVLTKVSADDYDADWETPSGGGTGTVTHTGGALTADQPVFGAGGADIKVGTKSGSTNEVATVSGSLTAGHYLTSDASGNVVDGGAPITLPIAESDVTGLVADLAAKVPTARTITTTAPLTGGGDLSADRTLAVSDATNSSKGVVQPDNSTIVVSGGVITAIAGGSGSGFAFGGDGSDGNVTLDGTNTYSFVSTSGSVGSYTYTLTRDVFALALTLSAGITLNTAGFRIFARISVTINGTAQCNGGNSTGQSGGTNALSGAGLNLPAPWSAASGVAGGGAKSGTTGAGGTGNAGTQGGIVSAGAACLVSTTGTAGTQGGTGGTSGANSGGTGGSGGSSQTSSNSATNPPREPVQGSMLIQLSSSNFGKAYVSQPGSAGGGSGGAGAGDGTNVGGSGGAGGGAGGGGGSMVIASPTITVGAAGTIQCNGGAGGPGSNGGNGAAGNAGGGGGGAGGSGGPGGIIVLLYHSYSNSGTVQCAGGTHGTGGTKGLNRGSATGGSNGNDGNDGPSGIVIQIPL